MEIRLKDLINNIFMLQKGLIKNMKILTTYFLPPM